MKYPNTLIIDILEGIYDENSKSLITKSGIESKRFCIVGYVVLKREREKFVSLFLNDGTGTIEVRIFDKEILSDIDLEKPLLVLGRISEFKGKKYIILDFFNNINEYIFNYLRVKAIKRLIKKGIKFEKEISIEKEEFERKEVYDASKIRKEIIRVLREMDEGKGVEIEKIYEALEYIDKKKIDEILKELIMNGEIYEPYPGRLKLLE